MLIERGLVGAAPDLVTAAHWYTKAAEQQHAGAEASLGRLHYQGDAPQLKDTSRAIHFLQRAAVKVRERQKAHFLSAQCARLTSAALARSLQGDADSQALLGAIYCAGDGVKRDVDRGVAFLRSVRRRAHTTIVFICDRMLTHTYMTNDLQAADSGSGDAMTRLALVLLTSVSLGRGDNGEEIGLPTHTPTSLRFGDREEIHDEALRLLLNAAATSPTMSPLGRQAHAQFALGELLESSPLLMDRAAALRFYSKAANATPVRLPCPVWTLKS